MTTSTTNFYSRKAVASEEAELEEFMLLLTTAQLNDLVVGAMYDSGSNCCMIDHRDGLHAGDPEARVICAIAEATITQFQWFGYIHHGRGTADL